MPPRGFQSTETTEIKKSRFITTIARTDTESQARAVIADVRALYPDARHHCMAFIIDDEGVRTARSSDDGEPSGTGGIPMMNALTQADLVNVTAVVTRYFGGIKLGASGLTRAYGGCVTQATSAMPRVTREVRTVWALAVPHNQGGRIQEDLLRAGGTIVDVSYDDKSVRMRFTYPDDPDSLVSKITGGQAHLDRDCTQIVEVATS